jgi:iron only hydrogenase large subunit-like protein
MAAAAGDVLPLISTVRSPQQIMGTIVKRFVARDLGKTAEQVYHATVRTRPRLALSRAGPHIVP